MPENVPDELMNKYKSEIPSKMDELKGLIEHYLEKKAELVNALHKIKGTAPMYGYEKVGKIAAAWHEILKNENILDGALDEITRGFDEQS